MIRNTSILLVLLAVVAPAAWADRKDELQARFKERFEAVEKTKHAGALGETFDGWLAAVKDQAPADDVKKLMADENADRKELYQLIAEEEKTTADKVGRRNAMRNYRLGKAGDWFKLESGEWKQKSG